MLASSIRTAQITRFRAMPTVKADGQVVDHIGGSARYEIVG